MKPFKKEFKDSWKKTFRNFWIFWVKTEFFNNEQNNDILNTRKTALAKLKIVLPLGYRPMVEPLICCRGCQFESHPMTSLRSQNRAQFYKKIFHVKWLHAGFKHYDWRNNIEQTIRLLKITLKIFIIEFGVDRCVGFSLNSSVEGDEGLASAVMVNCYNYEMPK